MPPVPGEKRGTENGTGPISTLDAYDHQAGTLNSDGGVVDLHHPTADGGGADATAVLAEGGTLTLPLSAAPGAGQYPLSGWTVDWGDQSTPDAPASTATQATHPYTDGGDTDTAQATALYGSGSNTATEPANPETVQVVDVPAKITSVQTSTVGQDSDDGSTPAGTTVDLTATFTDPGVAETHQATVDWGDGSGPTLATVNESGGTGTVTASHAYADAGSYTPTLTITDNGGGVTGSAPATATFPMSVSYVAPDFDLALAGPPPTAGTAGPSSPAGPGAAVSLAAGGPDANTVTGWTIDWGDGQQSTVTGPGVSNGGGGRTWPIQAHAYATPGRYLVTATPTDVAGAHADAATLTVAVADPAVTSLSATAADDNTVVLAWTPDPADGTLFEVDRRNPDGTWASVATVDDAEEGDSYTDYGLAGASTLAYRVRAVGATADLDSPFAAVSVPIPLTTPDAPTGLAATESTPGEVDLTWVEDSDIVTGYVVTATPIGGDTPIPRATGSTDTAFAFAGLTADAGYSFTVVADNNQGDGNDARSGPSDPLTAAPTGVALSATAPPTVAEGSALTLSVGSGPAGRSPPIVSWQVAWDDTSAVDTVAGSGGPDRHTPAAGAADVDATVTATDAAGFTFTLPPIETDVVPLAPTYVTATVVSGVEADLSWADASQSATGYTVLRADAGSATYADVADLPADSTGFQDASLAPGTQYSYEVGATGGLYVATESPLVSVPAVTTPNQQLTLSVDLGPASTGVADAYWHYQGAPASGFELEIEDLNMVGENFYDLDGFIGDAFPGPVDAQGNGYEALHELTPGDTISLRIRADLADGTVTDYTAPSTFTVPGLAAPGLVVNDDGSLSVAYAAGNAARFDFEFRGWSAPGPGWWQMDPDEYPFSFDDLGSSGGTVSGGFYFFNATDVRVRALGPGGATLWSGPVTGQPDTSGDTLAPPTVKVKAVSNTEVDVTVTGGLDGTIDGGYDVYLDGPTGGEYDETAGGLVGRRHMSSTGSAADGTLQHVFKFTGLVTGTAYYASATSNGSLPDGSDAASGYADPATATTLGTIPPAAPSFAQAIYDPSVGPGQAVLHWANTPYDESGYTIYREIPNPTGSYTLTYVAKTSADETSYKIRLLPDDGPYEYRIYSRNAGGESKGFARAYCAAIGGPDITAHLVAIANRLVKIHRLRDVARKLK